MSSQINLSSINPTTTTTPLLLSSSSTSSSSSSSSSSCLPVLPDEILLHILSYLDIPDLHALTQTSVRLRLLARDPLLHLYRLHRVPATLTLFLPFRPSLADLIAHRIYVTRTTLAARRLGRDLIRIKLNRKLVSRPSVETLIDKGVLPGECYGSGKVVAPGLVEVKRRIERERVKDGLRAWVEVWRRKGREREEEMVEERVDVRWLVRRFGRQNLGRDIPRTVKRREDPTRANVLGLRKFWERVGREGASAPQS